MSFQHVRLALFVLLGVLVAQVWPMTLERVRLVLFVLLGALAGHLWQETLTRGGERLRWLLALLLVPLGLLAHAVGRELATWMVGGPAIEFGLVGVRSRAGSDVGGLGGWWLAVAGTFVALCFAAALWAIARRLASTLPRLSHLLFAGALLNAGFLLVVDPVASALDDRPLLWSTIYDFSATPIASALTASIHLGLVGAAVVCRRRLYEVEWAFRTARRADLARLRATIERDPRDLRARQNLARLYFDGRRPAWTADAARDGLLACGEDAVLYSILGGAQIRMKRFEAAQESLARAAEWSAGNPQLQSWIRANQAIALAASGQPSEALDRFSTLDGDVAQDRSVQVWRQRARDAETAAASASARPGAARGWKRWTRRGDR